MPFKFAPLIVNEAPTLGVVGTTPEIDGVAMFALELLPPQPTNARLTTPKREQRNAPRINPR
jgi:hypothetical protein